MKKLLLFFVSGLLPVLLLAGNITVEKAHSVAESFFKDVKTRVAQPQLTMIWDGEDSQTRSLETKPAFYVFNRTDGKGFIIISGDDTVIPILGYSFTDNFVIDGMPSNIRGWMNGLKQQINAARAMGAGTSVATATAWKDPARNALGTVEVEYTTAKWDQTAPYDGLCPKIGLKRTVTGCVATALAIIMKYHQWPDKGVGTLPSYTYEIKSDGLKVKKTVDRLDLGSTYNWSKMPLTYDARTSEESKTEVATLMYHCGVMSRATFNTAANGGTGAVTFTAMEGLAQYMKYDKGMRCLNREWYSDVEWVKMIREEICSVGPVLYGGLNQDQEGHQFVLDGYTTENYFSVNWGWGGYANGYFLLSALEPKGVGTGGGSGSGFILKQNAVFGMKKAVEPAVYNDIVAFFSGESSDGSVTFKGIEASTTDFQTNQSFTMDVGFFMNYSLRDFVGGFRMALLDKNSVLKEYISGISSMRNPLPVYGGVGITGWECKITKPIEGGDKICAFYKSADSNDWKIIRRFLPDVIDEIIIKPDPTSLEKVQEKDTETFIAIDSENNVTIHAAEAMEEILLYNLDGRILKKISTDMDTDFTFSATGYPTGVYLLKVKTGKSTETCKFVKK